MLFQIFFHHNLMIIVFIDQSFLIYWHLNEGNFKSNYSPMERYLYLKIKSKHYFLECLNSNNVLLYCDCVFQFRIAGIFMYRICWIAGIFTYVKLLVFSGMSGLMTQRVDELFAALLQNAPVTTTVIREAKQEYDRLRVSSL